MNMGAGMLLMLLSLAGIVIFSAVLLSTRHSQARKKEEIYRAIRDDYARRQ